MDVSNDELFEFIDRSVRNLLQNAGVSGPAVDALELAESYFRIPVEYIDEEEAGPRRYGDAPKRSPRAGTILLRFDQSDEAKQVLAARAVARQLLPDLYRKIGIVPGTENRSAEKQLIHLIVPRLLLPGFLFAALARKSGFDLFAIKELFPTAPYDFIAWRMLEIDEEASVVAIVDDGTVTARRSNRFPVNKVLTEAERLCVQQTTATKDPSRIRRDDWTAWGWPVSGIPFRRIILRSVPDGI